MSFELYSFPSSFYSQKAQLALHAKGVEYKTIDVNIRTLENLQPWYMRINPVGKVPTLRHGDILIPDSSAIITYLDQSCGGLKLEPDATKEPGKSIRKLYNKIDNIKVRVLTMGSFIHPELAATVKTSDQRKQIFRERLVNNRDKDVLETLVNENPEMKDYYKDRLKTAQDFDAKVVFSKEKIETAKEEVAEAFKEAEQQLNKMNTEYGGRPSWLFGSDITAADVALVITLFRLSNLGLSKLWEGKLPKLERYFIYARENFPGFKKVTENGF